MLNKLKELREANEEGFTLIELLVVIVIIGILAAIALPIFLNQQKAAIAASIKSDVKNTQINVATYLVKNPTAVSLDGTWTGATSTTNQDATSGAKYKMVKTGEKTKMYVRGDWNNYTVRGISDELTGEYLFDSATGKYTGSGDLQ